MRAIQYAVYNKDTNKPEYISLDRAKCVEMLAKMEGNYELRYRFKSF